MAEQSVVLSPATASATASLQASEAKEDGATAPINSDSAQIFLRDVLELEEIDEGLYRGHTPDYPGLVRIFGGQTIAQALAAAGRTVSDKLSVHSLHAYFLRPGDLGLPILYQVKAIRNGRSFSTRLVQATQKGAVIFSLLASFHIWEEGAEHQLDAPTGITPPEVLPDQELVWREIVRLHGEELQQRQQRPGSPRSSSSSGSSQDQLPESTGFGCDDHNCCPRDGASLPSFVRPLAEGGLVIRNVDPGTTTVLPRPGASSLGGGPPRARDVEHPPAAPLYRPDPSTPEQAKLRNRKATAIAQRLPRLPKEAIQYLSLRLRSPLPLETRPANCSYYDYLRRRIPVRQPEKRCWIRAAGRLGDEPHIHKCAAAFMSDNGFMGTAFLPHSLSWALIGEAASLDHSMWFHRPFRADDWLLFVSTSWQASNAVGLNFGRIYDRDGNLVITCAQQGLMRLKSQL